jgi:hypothetical protein
MPKTHVGRAPRRCGVAGLLILLCLVVATPASASSIAFVRDGDVYLVSPDGAREHRVTSGGGYLAVTQSDDGTIFAYRAEALDRLDQNGRQLAAPIRMTALDPDVSPDGTKIAIWYPTTDARGETIVVNADGTPGGYGDQSGWHPTWIDNDLLLYSNSGGNINTLARGAGNWSTWFGDPDGRKYASAITRGKDTLVAVYRDWDDIGRVFGPWKIAWYANSAAPPTDGASGGSRPASERPVHRCTVDNGDAEPSHPSFAPDGSAIAWEMPDGVHVRPLLDLGSCVQPAGGFTIPGAVSPDWGPADVPAPGASGGPLVSAKAVAGQRLRRALAKGFKIRIVCSAACAVAGELRHGKKLVAKGGKTFSSGKGKLKLKFTKAGKKRLKPMRKAKLKLLLAAVDGQDRRNSASGRVTLKR